VRRIVLIAAVWSAACAGVTGLGDYTIASDETLDGGIAITPPSPPTDAGSLHPDAAPIPDAATGSLTISPSTLPAGTINQPYSQSFVASGGESPYAFRIVQGSLLGGLTLSTAGVLSGTPAVSGTSTFSVAVTDPRGLYGEQTFELDVGGPRQFSIGNSNNVVLATVAGAAAAQGGSFMFTIESGTVVGSTDATKPALTTGSFPAGSVVLLVNKGSIEGMGGAGGVALSITLGGDGSPGGAAISLGTSLRIDNTAGMIFGGGGGGGSTSSGWSCGGGGGQGSGTSAGGNMPDHGGNGGPSGPGAGATNSSMHSGAGGVWGTVGDTATSNSAVTGGKGGAGGAAILENGHTVEWIGGNDATHVKGAQTP
jgi:hypothetical protein